MIHLVDIAKQYEHTSIVHNISCTIPTNSITLIIGENGAGKSTLLRMLASLEEPTRGSISVPDSTTVGYLGHSNALYPLLTAMENLQFWANLYDKEHSCSALLPFLQRVNLQHVQHRQVRLFSRGMVQRLAIARLLLEQPTLILLDEPSTGLDTASITLLHKEVLLAKEAGKTIFWITHSLDTDSICADYILQIHNKTLGFFGTIQEYSTIQA